MHAMTVFEDEHLNRRAEAIRRQYPAKAKTRTRRKRTTQYDDVHRILMADGYYDHPDQFPEAYEQRIEMLYHRYLTWQRTIANTGKRPRDEDIDADYLRFMEILGEPVSLEKSKQYAPVEPLGYSVTAEEQLQVPEVDPAAELAQTRAPNDSRFDGTHVRLVQVRNDTYSESDTNINRYLSGRCGSSEVVYYNGCSYPINVMDRAGFVKRLGDPENFSGSATAHGISDQSLLNTAMANHTNNKEWEYHGRGLYIKVRQTMHMEALYSLYQYYLRAKEADLLKDSRILSDIATVIVGDSKHGNVKDFVARNSLFHAQRHMLVPYRLEMMYFIPEADLDRLHTYYEHTLDVTITKAEHLATYAYHPNQGGSMRSIFWRQAQQAQDYYQKYYHHVAHVTPDYTDDVYLRVGQQGAMAIDREIIMEGRSYVEINITNELHKANGDVSPGNCHKIYLDEADAKKKLAAFDLYLSEEEAHAGNDAKLIVRLNDEIENLKRQMADQAAVFKLEKEELKAQLNDKVREYKERIAHLEHEDKVAQVQDNAEEREVRRDDNLTKRQETARRQEEVMWQQRMDLERGIMQRDAAIIEASHKASLRESDNLTKNITVGGAVVAAVAGGIVAAGKIASSGSKAAKVASVTQAAKAWLVKEGLMKGGTSMATKLAVATGAKVATSSVVAAKTTATAKAVAMKAAGAAAVGGAAKAGVSAGLMKAVMTYCAGVAGGIAAVPVAIGAAAIGAVVALASAIL